MGEAFLLNNGGGLRLKGLLVATMPGKVTYVVYSGSGQAVDMTGAKIVAQIGGELVTLTEDNYTVVPSGNVTGGTTAIVVSATLGGVTKDVKIPITVIEPDPILNNNSWEVISLVSSTGHASDIWNVGDIKTETINGVAKSFRILDFNHDPLSSADEKYNDTQYNAPATTGNTRYAGITFQATESFGKNAIHPADNWQASWETSNMRNNILKNDLESFPSDMQAVIRTVDKITGFGGNATEKDNIVVSTADKLFLLSSGEFTNDTSVASPGELSNVSKYAFYEDVLSGIKPLASRGNEWSRSPHKPSRCVGSHFVYCRYTGSSFSVSFGVTTSDYDYYPTFCV